MSGAGDILRRYREAFADAWEARHDNKASTRRRLEADFLPAVLEIQESPPNPLARATVYVIIAFFVIAIGWMIIGKIDIVATAVGKIIPDARIKIVQTAEGGIVQEILTKDGDEVAPGQVLFVLDQTLSDANMAAMDESLQAARLEEEMSRLLAASPDELPQLQLSGILPARLARQQEVLRGIYREHRERIAQLEEELETLLRSTQTEAQGVKDSRARLQQETAINQQKEEGEIRQINKIRQLLPLAEEEYNSMRRLFEDSVVSKVRMQQSQEKYISLKEDLAYRKNVLAEIRASGTGRTMELEQRAVQHENRIWEQRARQQALKKSLQLAQSTFEREMGGRQEQAAREISQIEQELIKLKQSQKHNEISAPVGGIVQQMAVHTEGAVVQPAQSLLVIVPAQPVLEIEAMVENKDIGFVNAGQAVEIKIDAFPYTKYGLIDGHVEHLSADAIEDEARGLVYQARIRMARDTVIAEGKEVRLSPGMSVVAEIKTGERRVIEFFLSPLLRHGKESLSER